MLIRLSQIVEKQLARSPKHITEKYNYWVALISYIGLREARKYKGFHDEPLKDKGQARGPFASQKLTGLFTER